MMAAELAVGLPPRPCSPPATPVTATFYAVCWSRVAPCRRTRHPAANTAFVGRRRRQAVVEGPLCGNNRFSRVAASFGNPLGPMQQQPRAATIALAMRPAPRRCSGLGDLYLACLSEARGLPPRAPIARPVRGSRLPDLTPDAPCAGQARICEALRRSSRPAAGRPADVEAITATGNGDR